MHVSINGRDSMLPTPESLREDAGGLCADPTRLRGPWNTIRVPPSPARQLKCRWGSGV